MPVVQLAFSAAPQYVRTARLVGVAVAHRAGVADGVLEDIRLAIGEACGRAVARQRRRGVTELIRVEMSDDGPYTVRVIDSAGRSGEDSDEDGSDWMGDVLLAGLVEDLQVTKSDEGIEVCMSWRAHQHRL